MAFPSAIYPRLNAIAAAPFVGCAGASRRGMAAPTSTKDTAGLRLRAGKTSRSKSDSRERADSSSSSSSSSGRSSGGGRKGSVVEKSPPAQKRGGGGKGGKQPGRMKGGQSSVYTTKDLESSNVAASTLTPGPGPPAGFVLDKDGGVALVAPAANRIVTITDPSTQRPLECMIRRAFKVADGATCLLLLPLDMPIQILKIDEEGEGLAELSDEELQSILPSAIYALAKRRLHLILSGFCLTARGGFCYTEEHVLDFDSEYGEGLGGSLTEGVEIAHFQVEDIEYMIHTPFDPVMFVVRRDETTGELTIADDELMDDESVFGAIDEENEFQALVDEEDAINDTLRGTK